ncbi:CarD family transcriptional regulator [Bacillus sp. FJAT-27231]|uniref:CarD family transcriptional regulator n=1 Tax=Bacillus sp. FJAT-27231 TaxID=1679168 RepID=UPI00067126FC|nr:CarD family transcriptional regulator [Bacillus sp. FJAT-27231]KMY52840.1 CarD family transcriptional regulator [Bacillus sp. FJAT-27231]
MFHIGDLVVYSAHGVCQIDEIGEKAYFGAPREYYTLHPLENNKLTISVPVDHEEGAILRIIDRNKAEEILHSFTLPGMEWIEKGHDRARIYSTIVKTGNRNDIAKIVNTLMRKKDEAERDEKKLGEFERQLLHSVQKTLFTEIAISLQTTYDAIYDEAARLVKLNH